MPTFTFPRPAGLQDEDAGRLDGWLAERGIDARVQIHSDGTVSLIVPDGTNEHALRETLVTYARAETAREQFEREAIAEAVQLVKAIAGKPTANRTPVERVLLGLSLAIREVKQEV